MTSEEQNIAIAEACGRVPVIDRDGDDIPDYLNDLSAMHEAVMAVLISDDQKANFFHELVWNVIGYDRPVIDGLDFVKHGFAAVNATAAQRAEAFLRTVGKWEDLGWRWKLQSTVNHQPLTN